MNGIVLDNNIDNKTMWRLQTTTIIIICSQLTSLSNLCINFVATQAQTVVLTAGVVQWKAYLPLVAAKIVPP